MSRNKKKLAGIAGIALIATGLALFARGLQQDRAEEARVHAAQVRIDKCAGLTTAARRAAADLSSDLYVGLPLMDYSERTRDLMREVDRLESKDSACDANVVQPLKTMATGYAVIASDWNDCVFDDYSCDTDDYEDEWATTWRGLDEDGKAIRDWLNSPTPLEAIKARVA